MADAKISQLPAATTPLAGIELVAIVQDGATKQVAADQLGKSSLAWTSITATPTTLSGYGITDALSSSYVPSWTSISDKPATFAPSAHTHDAADITGVLVDSQLPQTMTGKVFTAAITATGNNALLLKGGSADRTYLSFYPDVADQAIRGAMVGFTTAGNRTFSIINELSGNMTITADNVTISSRTNGHISLNPGTGGVVRVGTNEVWTAGNFTPSTKLDTSAFTFANLGSKPTTLSGYGITDAAPLNSPAFTGTPTAPTQTAGNNTTRVATTAFVTAAVSTKANLASPTFTGTPAAPTATAGTNTTQVATTAFVTTAVSNAAVPKGMSSFVSGKPTASQVVGAGIAPYAFTIGANTQAIASVAATASTVFTIKKNGTDIGTVTFSAAATAGVESMTVTSVAAGDRLSIHAPATPDATLADISFLVRE